MAINNRRELWIARTCTLATLVTLVGLFHFLALRAQAEYAGHHMHALIRTAVFTLVMFLMSYGGIHYQVCRMGYYKRAGKHRPVPREVLESIYGVSAPALTVLIPSYKEEYNVIWQTMVSAALSEYPRKEIMLLIDDPLNPKTPEDLRMLKNARRIPEELQQRFDAPLKRYRSELEAFEARMKEGRAHPGVELNRLSILCEEVAGWMDVLTTEFLGGRAPASLNHIDRFFLEQILQAPAQAHHARAMELRRLMRSNQATLEQVLLQYRRLAGIFDVRFGSFSRKKYANLSHEANKAMNINSYLSLMGKSWKEVESKQGMLLQECGEAEADFTIPAPDYINTIDADSVMLSDYALRLVHIMEQPGNERVAVSQSPCSAFPECPKGLERIAGIAIDMGFMTHQGYTHWGATFWVGANAMLRYKALQEIRETRVENGHTVSIFIQDRTVIEDTESSIDLVHKGWRLYNYPDRLTFSPTPPDFGSLLIQRRRWATGQLIILPKLLHYALRTPKTLALGKELFMRLNYLLSVLSGCFISLALALVSFGSQASNIWVELSFVPVLILFLRDLRVTGYGFMDFFRTSALNLMLMPVMMGGMLKTIEQIVTGRKIAFGRTPKVPGRTAAPALYSLIQIVLPCVFLKVAVMHGIHHHWAQALVPFMSSVFLLYALVFFIGVKAAVEDVMAGAKEVLLAVSGKVEEVLASARRIPLLVARLQSGNRYAS